MVSEGTLELMALSLGQVAYEFGFSQTPMRCLPGQSAYRCAIVDSTACKLSSYGGSTALYLIFPYGITWVPFGSNAVFRKQVYQFTFTTVATGC